MFCSPITYFGFCRLHSTLAGIEKAAADGRIGVDAAVAEERPVAARVFKQREIDLANQDFLLFVRSLRNDAAEGIGKEAAAPELQARARWRDCRECRRVSYPTRFTPAT